MRCLAHSPGCRPAWLAEFPQACQRFGEPPAGWNGPGAMFALRLPSGPWAVVGVSSPGTDDRGRPGALAFHGLFVRGRDLRRSALGPFALAGALRRDWGPATTALPSATWTLDETTNPPVEDADDTPRRIAQALVARRRVVIESAAPIEPLARRVWPLLDADTRRRASVATLAFSLANDFDLVALPRLAGIEVDSRYDTLETLATALPGRPARWQRRHVLAASGAVGLAALVLGTGYWVLGTGHATTPSAYTPRTASDVPNIKSPVPNTQDPIPIGPDDRDRIAEGLLDLAERFGVADGLAPQEAADPTALMQRIAARLRYRGALAVGRRARPASASA